MNWPTVIDLNFDEYNQGLSCYPFMADDVTKDLIMSITNNSDDYD